MFELTYDQDANHWLLTCLTHNYTLTFEQATVASPTAPDRAPVRAISAIYGVTIDPETESRIPASHWRMLGVTPQRVPTGVTLWRLLPDGRVSCVTHRNKRNRQKDD